MKIELLYFAGCPTYKRAEELLKEVLEDIRAEASVEVKKIDSPEQAEAEKFLGSPSIRVNGVDIDPAARESFDFGLKCRIYHTAQGLRGWPDKEMISLAIVSNKRT